MKTFYEIKNIGDNIVKDFDFKSRTVTGYFSRFGNVDHDGDILMPGAFTKSIKERGQEGKNLIPHLADHMMDTDHLLSKPKLYEVADGGFFESTITDTTKALDVLKQYRDGLISNHSFGFKVLRKENKGDYREIKEVLLYEISSVVLGANDNTPFTGFKSLTAPQMIQKYNHLQKCFREGDYSDEFFAILEAQIKQLEQEMVQIVLNAPVDTKWDIEAVKMPMMNEPESTQEDMTENGEECPDCGSMMEQQGNEMVCPNCGKTIHKQLTTETTTPTVDTVTLPGVDVDKLNNIYKLLKVDNDRP